MTEQQIPQLAGALVTHQRHFGALPTDDAQWAIQNTQAAIALCVEAIKNRANGVAMTEPIVLSVDYGQSLEQMIVAGNYDWTNSDITVKRFGPKGEGIQQFEAKVFHFDRNISSKIAVEEIKAADTANPWEPGKIEHLLAFGVKYPEEQRKYPIIGLGSVAEVRGGRDVPYLYRVDRERDLGLCWWGNDWGGRCRFLAVRKLSSATQA